MHMSSTIAQARKRAERNTPNWVLNAPVSIIKRGDELWWSNGAVTVQGSPPPGVMISDKIIEVAEDWGPIGNPEQLRPGALCGEGTISFIGKSMDTVVQVVRREYTFLSKWSGSSLVWFHYPPRDGKEQMLAVFERWSQPIGTPTEALMGAIFGNGEVESEQKVMPYAFVSRLVPNDDYFLDPLAMAMIPRMSGHTDLEEYHR